jgi:hypothetical protein
MKIIFIRLPLQRLRAFVGECVPGQSGRSTFLIYLSVAGFLHEFHTAVNVRASARQHHFAATGDLLSGLYVAKSDAFVAAGNHKRG